MISVPKEVAMTILNMYDELASANNMFKQCQSTAFKNFAQSMLNASNTRKAIAELRKAAENNGKQ